MRHKEFLHRVAEATGESWTKVRKIHLAIIEESIKALAEGEEVYYPAFCKFVPKYIPARTTRTNLITAKKRGRQVHCDPKYKIEARVSNRADAKVNEALHDDLPE
jgi:nucleoid DNA-binding protein